MKEASQAPLFPDHLGRPHRPALEHGLNNQIASRCAGAPRLVAGRHLGAVPQRVQALAKGLMAAGISHGDRIAIASATRYEWTLADYAGWFAGATVVPSTRRPRPSRWSGSSSNAECTGVFLEAERHRRSSIRWPIRSPPSWSGCSTRAQSTRWLPRVRR